MQYYQPKSAGQRAVTIHTALPKTYTVVIVQVSTWPRHKHTANSFIQVDEVSRYGRSLYKITT